MVSDTDTTMTVNLFNCKDKPLTFYMIPCKQKRALRELIEKHGGVMTSQRREAQYMLYRPGDIVSNRDQVSTCFIEDCVKQQRLLDVEEYRYSARSKQEKASALEKAADQFAFNESNESSSSKMRRYRKKEYTVEEDMMIINAVLKQCRDLSINGNRLWEIIATNKNIDRSSQSLKERFIKKILPYAANYNITPLELQKLRRLSAAKTEKVVAGAQRLSSREQLSFLRAPSSATHAASNQMDSSSSDENSFAAKVLVPQAPLARRRKPLVIELSSTSGPSSQSEGSQPSQQTLKNQPLKDKQKHSKARSPMNRNDSHLSKAEKRSPVSVRTRSGSLASSGEKESYIIEDPSPDICVSSPDDLPPPILFNRKKKLEETDQADLYLLGTPRKKSPKPIGVNLTTKHTVSQQDATSKKILSSSQAVAKLSISSELNKDEGVLSLTKTRQSEEAPVLEPSEGISVDPPSVPTSTGNCPLTQSSATISLPVQKDLTSQPVAEPSNLHLKRIVESNGECDLKITNIIHNAPSANPPTELSSSLPFAQNMSTDTADQSNEVQPTNAQLDTLSQASQETEVASSMPQPIASVSVDSQACSQSAIVSSQRDIQDPDTVPTPPLPVTDSDELFRGLVMSDTMQANHDLLRSISKESISNMDEKTGEHSSQPQPKCSAKTELAKENTETQLTWSSFDLESQKTNRFSLDSAKSVSGNCDSRGNASLLANVSQPAQILSNSSTKTASHLSPKKTSPIAHNLHVISSPESPFGKHVCQESISKAQPEQCHSTPNFKPCTSVDLHISPVDPNIMPPDTVIEEVSPTKFSEHTELCEKVTTTPDTTQHLSTPPFINRQSSLKHVLQLPLRSPQYEDAESSIASVYMDCQSNRSDATINSLAQDSNASKNTKCNHTTTMPDCSSPSESTAVPIDSPCAETNVPAQNLPNNERPEVECYSKVKVEMRSTNDLEPVPGTSEETCDTNIDMNTEDLQIAKCTLCAEDRLCRMNELKTHDMYLRLMCTYQLRDPELLPFVLSLSADWELIEQHIKSCGEVGERWTSADDALLFNVSFRRRNMKTLRRKFSTRELSARKAFLLHYVALTAKQRKTLLNM